jgi:hypothetical protein
MRIATVCEVSIVIILCGALSFAQEFSPSSFGDPYLRGVQAKYGPQLRELATEITQHSYPYKFSLGSVVPKDAQQPDLQGRAPIRFDKYNGALALEISGNYSVSYTDTQISKNERARHTLTEVIVPVLKAATETFHGQDVPRTYLIEVSHHVRSKILGIPTEGIETVALFIPQLEAESLAHAKTVDDQQQALLDGTTYLNAQPFLVWLTPDEPSQTEKEHILERSLARQRDPDAATTINEFQPSPDRPLVSERLLKPTDPIKRKMDPLSVEQLNAKYTDLLERLVRDLDSQMHFATYAPPTFIEFNGHKYLQLSFNTTLAAGDVGSRYKLAALAFDDHITHFIRPVLAILPETGDWDGVVFSAILKVQGNESTSEAAEFFFTDSVLRSYKKYDLNGQQLIDHGLVLIDGERAQVDLLKAEASAPAPNK